jgi:hypothetical protein
MNVCLPSWRWKVSLLIRVCDEQRNGLCAHKLQARDLEGED